MKPLPLIARIALLAVCGLALPAPGHGQAVTITHSFAADGEVPTSPLIQETGGVLYGTTSMGGAGGGGGAFETSPQGPLIFLHRFGSAGLTNDGLHPTGLIYASDGNFYGTTSNGGSAGKGTVFAMNSLGAVTILHSFGDNSVANDGSGPAAGLTQGADGNFYGTTPQGGSAGKGVVFEISAQGVMTILHSFGDGTIPHDGAAPEVGLVQDAGGNFYGTTSIGGSANQGTVYVINAQKQLSILYSFSPPASISFNFSTLYTMNTAGGSYPNSRLLLATDGNLYGTTAASGYGYGAVFRITPQGRETVLHYFGDGSVSNDGREGAQADYALIEGSDGNLYGTTSAGGAAGKGTVFEMTLGGQVTILHSFADGTVVNDGATPEAGVIQGFDGNFYGTTSAGGSAGLGAVFQVNPGRPEITSSLAVDGAAGRALHYQILATQTPTAYSATGLPDGLILDGTTGLISGTPTATGTSRVTLTVTNSNGGTNSALLVVSILPPPVITSVLREFGSTSAPFGYQISADGSPAGFDATGLPAGLSVDPATGIISGTPTVTGTFSATLSAANVAGSDSRTLTLVVTAAVPALSQDYVQLHQFNDGSVPGEGIYAGPVIPKSDGTLFGVTAQGGGHAIGTVFHVSPAGSAGVLAGMDGANGSSPLNLIQGSDGDFYGVTGGGSDNQGTVFKVTAAGVVTILHAFGDGSVVHDGANPQDGVIQGADGNFYGTTQYGGSANLGTLFKMTPEGAVTILHSFGDGSVLNDGAQPVAALVQASNGTFYGTTQNGGSAGDGTVFALAPNEIVSILHSFADGTVANDGYLPHAQLALDSEGNLIGTTNIGGSAGKGTVFRITPAGMLTILHHFGDGTVANDGVNPLTRLIACDRPASGATIFGLTPKGGTADEGTLFEIDSAHTLTVIHNFADGSVPNDGDIPLGLCLGADGNLYGTTLFGGAGYGTAFAIVANLNPPPPPVPPASYWTLTGNLPSGMTFDDATGTFAGTPLPGDSVGGYPVSITHVVNGHANAAQTIAIDLTESFGQWATAHSISASALNTLPKDGVSYLLKYLCGVDPTTPISAADRAVLPTLGTTTADGFDYLTLTYRQSAASTGLTVTVLTSADLQNWQPVDPQNLLSQQMDADAAGNAIMEVGVKVTGGAHQFLRLNVAAP